MDILVYSRNSEVDVGALLAANRQPFEELRPPSFLQELRAFPIPEDGMAHYKRAHEFLLDLRRREEQIAHAHAHALASDRMAVLGQQLQGMKEFDKEQGGLLERLLDRRVIYLAPISLPSNAPAALLAVAQERTRLLEGILGAIREYNEVVRQVEAFYVKNERPLWGGGGVIGFVERTSLPREIRI